jgi:hypothetical protein
MYDVHPLHRGDDMSALGYIFLTMGREGPVAPGEQQKAIQLYGKSAGFTVEEFFVEQGVSLKSPFRERKEASRLLAGAQPGDTIITLKSEWIFGSAKGGSSSAADVEKKLNLVVLH